MAFYQPLPHYPVVGQPLFAILRLSGSLPNHRVCASASIRLVQLSYLERDLLIVDADRQKGDPILQQTRAETELRFFFSTSDLL
ncbi:hypothetical protein SBA4_5580005 [Candidatus Sulfopaludibacter sp. SbA4]|nr:hypothetical protein SBA4_5580005 [Candidatus Sulfopaludibacter sp. SbA4]